MLAGAGRRSAWPSNPVEDHGRHRERDDVEDEGGRVVPRHIEDPAHLEKLLARRKAGHGPKSRDRLLDLCPEARVYLHEVARRKIHLSHEVDKLLRLVDSYGATDVGTAIGKAIAQKTFGARYVRALCDQARFARGLPEPPEPVVTGNPTADDIIVEPHAMETYDALFQRTKRQDPKDRSEFTQQPDPDPDDSDE